VAFLLEHEKAYHRIMSEAPRNTLVVLGPTASGKTALGIHLARMFDGEILSADSRQVYQGLDIGAGKDLEEYTRAGAPVAYHLIDTVGLDEEFNVFAYQRSFFEAFEDVTQRSKRPMAVGGTGLYLEAVLKRYVLVETPEDPSLRNELAELTNEGLGARLTAAKPGLHNTTDVTDRARTIRAIEIAEHKTDTPPPPAPDIRPLILGIRWKREVLRQRIAVRLKERLNTGLIEEVEDLHQHGVSWERLELLGLEYRFLAQYIQGHIKNKNDLFQKLNGAIARFAKRQETWFRRMEKNGICIHWIDEADESAAHDLVKATPWATR
jgi:tRNA dimethylallyltransferase